MALVSYRDLRVWQKAMDLVEECYRIARLLPKTELFGLISQTQRAAVSVPANIAEGHGREHLKEYLHHLSVANGSLMELETHLLLMNRLSFLPSSETRRALSLCSDVGRMLCGLRNSLKSRARNDGKPEW